MNAPLPDHQDPLQHFEAAIAGANVGLWLWDARTARSTINQQWASMLGYALDEVPQDNNGWLTLVHPDDVPGVQAAAHASFHEKSAPYEVEFRMRHKDGGWRWVQSRGRVIEWSPQGTPLRVAGSQIDVTARREAVELLRRQLALGQAVNRLQAAALQHGADTPQNWEPLMADLLALTHGTAVVFAHIESSTPRMRWWLPNAPDDTARTLFDEAAAALAQGHLADGPWSWQGSAPAQYRAAVPIRIADETVALVGVARPDVPFSPEDTLFLAPLLGAAAQLLQTRRAERQARAAEARSRQDADLLARKQDDMHAMLDSIAQGISLTRADHRLAAYNRRYRELLDLPESLLAPLPTVDKIVQFQAERGDFGETFALIDPEARGYVAAEYAGHADPDKVPDVYLRKSHAGKVIEVRTHHLADGGRVRTFTDVSSYVAAQTALRDSEARFRSLTELISDWYWEQDAQGRFTKFEASRQLGALYDFRQMLGRTAHEAAALIHYAVDAQRWQEWDALQAAHREFRDFEFAAEVVGLQGLRHFSLSGLPTFDARGQFLGYRGTGRDITERKQAEAQIERLAFYDALCNLPNRRLLTRRLAQAQAASHRTGRHGALLFIDLDNFKDLNDTLGHAMGDTLLKLVAQRLVDCVREDDTVARFGGDEFVVMLEHLSPIANDAREQADTVAKKIAQALNVPYDLAGTPHHSTPSLGVTLFLAHHQKLDELLQRADLAMYQAKGAGRNAVRFFDPQMQAVAAERSALEADLRRALERDELRLHYQPIVDLRTQLVGVEALLRWSHPRRGLVPPVEFIALAERTGLILPLGDWVLESACRQLAAWAALPQTSTLSVAVNVSARQFRQPGFVAQVLKTLAHTGAPPAQLKLELTESMLLSDVEDAVCTMGELKAHGVGFALDDFGTGYSSLSYLKRLPLDQLKIDRTFVRDVLTDANDAAIARTILALARSLDLSVVAEGVELQGQRDFLAEAGCTQFQGYLFGRPMPPGQLLAQWTARD